jgi:hypothetical protein
MIKLNSYIRLTLLSFKLGKDLFGALEDCVAVGSKRHIQ